jgi:hypothetical protein
VSVLVVVQPSSEVPEGIMNYPVCNEGNVNGDVLDHISTNKLKLIYCIMSTTGMHCINIKVKNTLGGRIENR